MVGILNAVTKTLLSVYSRYQVIRYNIRFKASLNPESIVTKDVKDQSRMQAYRVLLDEELAKKKEAKAMKDKTTS